MLSSLACLILPLPAFVVGLIIPNPWAKLVFLLIAAVCALIGIGLLRLDRRARMALYVLMALGTINSILAPTAWFRHQLMKYVTGFYGNMSMPLLIDPSRLYTVPLMFSTLVTTLPVYAFILWLLHRHRDAFKRGPV